MKKIICGNWKFNKELRDVEKAIGFVKSLEEKKGIDNVEIKIFPHSLVLLQLAHPVVDFRHPDFVGVMRQSRSKIHYGAQKAKRIKLGSQDIHWEEDGSFTGAHFSAEDLIAMGVKEVLIGHSETRFYFGVTDEKVALKLKAALKNGILPTVCLGEDIEEKEKGKTKEALKRQIERGILPTLKELNSKPPFIIAYEPIYAIAGFAKLKGLKPKPAEIKDIELAHQTIREIFSENGYSEIKILYGGSSNPENVKELLSQTFIDGLLIGTASWELNSFFEIIKIAAKI